MKGSAMSNSSAPVVLDGIPPLREGISFRQTGGGFCEGARAHLQRCEEMFAKGHLQRCERRLRGCERRLRGCERTFAKARRAVRESE